MQSELKVLVNCDFVFIKYIQVYLDMQRTFQSFFKKELFFFTLFKKVRKNKVLSFLKQFFRNIRYATLVRP